jgi:hypothetical protein
MSILREIANRQLEKQQLSTRFPSSVIYLTDNFQQKTVDKSVDNIFFSVKDMLLIC